MSDEVRALVERYYPPFPLARCGRIFTDTTAFMDIDCGDVIRLGGRHYLVMRDEYERRFGIEDPKYWVKRCRILETSERKILKLVFYEDFSMHIGSMVVPCYRSPQKESRILNLVRGHPHFMQGETILDDHKNPVRVIDIIQGKRLDVMIEESEQPHRTYFHETFPEILIKYIDACEAIQHLHMNWEKHGDIRRDHLLIDYDTDIYRWIDFDYTFEFHENPFGLDLFGLGNILLFLVGKGAHTVQSLPSLGLDQSICTSITSEDCSIMLPNRVVNLKKLFPYIPEELNRILLRFSLGTDVFYDSVEELIEDLRPCGALIR